MAYAFNSLSEGAALQRDQEAAAAEVQAAYDSGTLRADNWFESKDEAAIAVLDVLEDITARHQVELGGFIIESGDGFSYGRPRVGNRRTVPYLSETPRPRGAVAGYHTHPSGSPVFGIPDARWVNDPDGTRLPLYVIGRGQVRVCGVGSPRCDAGVAVQFPMDERNRGLQGRIVR